MAVLINFVQNVSFLNLLGVGDLQFLLIIKHTFKLLLLSYLFWPNKFKLLDFKLNILLFILILFDPFLFSISQTVLRDDFIVVTGFVLFVILAELLFFSKIRRAL